MNKIILLLTTTLSIICILIPCTSFADTTFSHASDLQNTAISSGGIYNLAKSGSPYIFPEGIEMNSDVVVNVESGVIIESFGNGIIIQDGEMNINGATGDPVIINAHTNSSAFKLEAFVDDASFQPKLKIANSIINTSTFGITSFRNSHLNIDSVVFNNISGYGLYVSQNADVVAKNISGTAVLNSPFDLVWLGVGANLDGDKSLNVTITDTNFIQDDKHKISILTFDPSRYDSENVHIKFRNNIFSGNVQDKMVFSPAFDDMFAANFRIDAASNYWGTPNGPYNVNSPNITNGPQLLDYVDYLPFLTFAPVNEPAHKECCSSVIFIPGIEGSRLYNKRDNGTEDQLWEANWSSDLSDLYMDNSGKSIDNRIYTKDVIDKTNVVPDDMEQIFGEKDKDIYRNTLNFLQNQKNNNTIKSYTTYPYDWRLDLDDIVNNGTKMDDGSYRKLINVLHQQAAVSDTGKITIMAHSMGGLITKRFIQSLSPFDQALIDKLIMIAVPEVGTPEGATSLLNGLAFEDLYSIAAPQKYNRALSENMVSAHVLSPSDKYFNVVGISPVIFNNNLSNLLPEVSIYGNEINTGQELKNFLSGDEGRLDANFLDINYPNVSPTVVVNKAKELHDSMDNYNMPSFIKVFQIVGTGIPTIKQIEYIQKTSREGFNHVGYNIKNTLSGDGTVVKESANYLAGDTYYINLYKYNNDIAKNHKHKDISGLLPVSEVVNSIIKNEVVVQNGYISNDANLFNNVKLFTIGMHSPVDIHVYDEQARHTGPVYVNINGEIVRFIEENIPNMSYNEYGDDKYITGLDDKNYTLKLDGYDTGTFTLDVQRYRGDTPTTYESFSNLPSTDLLSSTINLLPETQIGNISLDTDSDGDLDLQASNNGKLKDLNKENNENCKKEKNDKKIKDKDKKCKEDKPDKQPKDKKDKNCKIYHEREKNYKNKERR